MLHAWAMIRGGWGDRVLLRWMLPLVALCVNAAGCATFGVRTGGYHVVRPTDTIQTIAAKYHVSVQQLAEWNNIQQERGLPVGHRLYIPARRMDRSDAFFATQILPNAPKLAAAKPAVGAAVNPKLRGMGKPTNTAAASVIAAPNATAISAAASPDVTAEAPPNSGEPAPAVDPLAITLFHGKFAWPLAGTIHSPFGIRAGHRHDGIDIGGAVGDPIHAAASGEVAFAGVLSGYGNIVIVRHPDNYYTAYAHNSANLVEKGARVRAGQTIAKVGATGRASGPHLHFEIRDGQQARNPLFFLAPRNASDVQYAKASGADVAAVVTAKSPSPTVHTVQVIPAPQVATAHPQEAHGVSAEKNVPPTNDRAKMVRQSRNTKPAPASAAPTLAASTASRWKKFTPAARQSRPKVNTPFRAHARGAH